MSQRGPKEMWEERYGSTDDYVYGTEPNDFLVEAVAEFQPGRAMCLADGEGRNSVYLAQLGFTVSAVDLSEAAVEKARRLAEQRGVVIDAQQGDLAQLDLGEGTYDLIVSIFAHCDEATRIDLHRRVVRALRPGGRLVLEAYTPEQIGRGTGGPQERSLTMDLERLSRELDGLELDVAVERLRPVHEGPLHTGEGAVVQVVARRP